MSDPTIRANCPYCGMLSSPGESFCRNCGRALAGPTVVSPQVPPPSIPIVTGKSMPVLSGQPINVGRKRRSPLLLGCLIVLALGVIALGAGSFYTWRQTIYTSPARRTPAMPERAAAALTEFPVDNDSDDPLTPASVESEALDGLDSTKSDSESQTKLPPGVTRASLEEGATSITAATYQKKTQLKSAVSHSENVYICVLTLKPNQLTFGSRIASTIVKETDGQMTTAKVESSTGFVYVGLTIRSTDGNVYVLNKQGTDILILIYSTDPNPTVIDRLARNVGNGQGLFDYPEIKDSLSTLPSTTPSGFTLIEINTINRAQIENSLVGDQKSDDEQKILAKIRSLIPNRLTSAKYLDANRQQWMTYTFEYSSSFWTWRNWMLARVWLSLAGGRRTTVHDVTGMYVRQEGASILAFQKGPYIIALIGPTEATSEGLVDLGNLFQV